MLKSTIDLYPTVVNYINAGLSTTQIAKEIGVSWPTILKLVRLKNEKNILEQLKINNNSSRCRGIIKSLGHAKGRTYEEIYGDRASEMRRKRSVWLKENNIRKHATRISKPQAILYSIVKSYFDQAELEYEVITENNKVIWLDIAIPDLKINIEYDGLYWHSKNKNTISLSDENRDKFLNKNGWKVFRIQSFKNLTEEELKTEFLKLQLI
jgi:hypothetical protein